MILFDIFIEAVSIILEFILAMMETFIEFILNIIALPFEMLGGFDDER